MQETQKDSNLDLDVFEDEDEDTQKDKFLTFRLENEDYGIQIRHITEIIVMQDITHIPDMPEFIIGLINLRGQIISIMDVRKRFRLKSKEYDDRTCIIVVNINTISVGLIVDTVNEVINIPENVIDPPPRGHLDIDSSYILGLAKVGKKVKVLVDIERILQDNEMSQIISVSDQTELSKAE